LHEQVFNVVLAVELPGQQINPPAAPVVWTYPVLVVLQVQVIVLGEAVALYVNVKLGKHEQFDPEIYCPLVATQFAVETHRKI